MDLDTLLAGESINIEYKQDIPSKSVVSSVFLPRVFRKRSMRSPTRFGTAVNRRSPRTSTPLKLMAKQLSLRKFPVAPCLPTA